MPHFIRVSPREVIQNISIGASSTASAAFGAKSKALRVCSTVDCYIAFSEAGAADPVASTSTIFLPAKTLEFFGVDPGGKIAVIQSASGGTLSITEGEQI